MGECFLDELMREQGIAKPAELARLSGVTDQEISRFRQGVPISEGAAKKLGPALNVAPLDLREGRLVRVRVDLLVASAFAEGRPAALELDPTERQWVEAPGLDRPRECFGARIIDDSADEFGYPNRSLLFVRRTVHLNGKLPEDAPVLVRFPMAPGTDEILAGTLRVAGNGDLNLEIESSLRDLPASTPIQHAAPRAGAEDPPARFRRQRGGMISYRPRNGDPGEILGVIELATAPQRPRPFRRRPR